MPSTPSVFPATCSATPRMAAKAAGIWSFESRIERSSEALTAAAVRGVPSEKTTPGRRWSRTASPLSSKVHFSQSAGARLPWGSVVTSRS